MVFITNPIEVEKLTINDLRLLSTIFIKLSKYRVSTLHVILIKKQFFVFFLTFYGCCSRYLNNHKMVI